MGELTLGADQNAGEVAVRVGDRIILRLPENSGGGYRWTLVSHDAASLEMVEQHYDAPRAGVGGVGTSVWTFTPTRVGRTRLELKKVRPWNASDPAGERFAVDLKIGAR